MHHHCHYPLVDIAIFIAVILLSLFFLMDGDSLVPARDTNMPAWCEHHDGHCPDVSADLVRSLKG